MGLINAQVTHNLLDNSWISVIYYWFEQDKEGSIV